MSVAVDLTPIVNTLTSSVAIALAAALGWLIRRAAQWLHVSMSAQATRALDGAAAKAIAFGLNQARAEIIAKGWDHPDVKNAALAVALPYLINRFPGTLKAVGIDITDPAAVDQAVEGLLDRAFPQAVLIASASPAMPSAVASHPIDFTGAPK